MKITYEKNTPFLEPETNADKLVKSIVHVVMNLTGLITDPTASSEEKKKLEANIEQWSKLFGEVLDNLNKTH